MKTKVLFIENGKPYFREMVDAIKKIFPDINFDTCKADEYDISYAFRSPYFIGLIILDPIKDIRLLELYEKYIIKHSIPTIIYSPRATIVPQWDAFKAKSIMNGNYPDYSSLASAITNCRIKKVNH